jgi:hypothetical protein
MDALRASLKGVGREAAPNKKSKKPGKTKPPAKRKAV